jgi:MFS transporter, DHA1 family, multidrug resistance protein
MSVYDLYTKRRRAGILLMAAICSCLIPLSDTIYLPALTVIAKDLNASVAAVSGSVSIFMFAAAAGSIFWGPISDRFGRRLTYLCSLTATAASSFGCLWAPSIGWLLALRALQGATGGACCKRASSVFFPAPHGAVA